MRASPHSRDRSLWVVLVALFVAATGMVARWGVTEAGASPSAWADIFPDGPWRVLAWGTLACGFLGLLASLGGVLRWMDRERPEISSASSRLPVRLALQEVRAGVAEALASSEADAPRVLDEVLRGALLIEASDVHLNPGPERLTVHYRADGVLHEVVSLSGPVVPRLVARIKVLSYLDGYAREPQDGSLRRRIGDVDVEARVSTLPANHGERIVLRLVRSSNSVPSLRELGFERVLCQRLEELLQKPQGMLYVSGPVGSGKTTTMYSALQQLHLTRGETTSLVSLEDPIEMQLPFATQTQINRKVGLGFAEALRSILRQDPGAIMLGEIRDKETAQIATQAGLTGHLILTTLHVQSASATFDRLAEMDVERFVLTSSCLGCLAQRLVRALCVECKRKVLPSAEISLRFTELGVDLPPGSYFEPVGCSACEGRGYWGRLPVAELLLMSEQLRAAVHRGESREAIHKIAVAEGMTSILDSALKHAQLGHTSLLEVLRVAG